LHCDGVKTLLNCYENTGIFRIKNDTESNSYGTRKTVAKYIVPIEVGDQAVKWTRYPRVHPLKPLTEMDIVDKVKPIFKGNAIISVSSKFKKTLDLSKSKRFSVNTTYVELLKGLLHMHPESVYTPAFENIDLPFLLPSKFAELEQKVEKSSSSTGVGPLTASMIEKIQLQLAGAGLARKYSYNTHLLLTGSTILECKLNSEVFSIQREAIQEQLRRK
jgi:hypothetical protein